MATSEQDINKIIEKLKEKSFKKEEVPLPKDQETFQVPDYLAIEIGCGAGMHPIQFNKKFPDKTLVAMEHTSTRFQKFLNRYHNHSSPKNLIPKHENAISWISHKLESESVDDIFLLYPNPFPKFRDYNKRWFCMPFFQQLISVLKDGGRITLATNEKFYVDEARYLNDNFWNLIEEEYRTLDQDDAPRTHFEKKYLARELSCYNLVLRK